MGTDIEPLEIRASDSERRQVVASLQAACVEGRLNLDEYSQRVEQAIAARTRGQLEALLVDLPAETGAAQAAARALPRTGGVATTIAVLGQAQRSGFWRMAEMSRVISVLGTCKLDLRSARVSSAVTTVDVSSVLGAVDVIVPAGVEVDLEVHAVLGARDVRLAGTPPAPGAPIIRITGIVVLGALNVRDAAAHQAHIDVYG
jgi:hypothetical protein